MAKKSAKYLVGDASIAYAAGGQETTGTDGKSCRDFLEVLRDRGHFLVMTEAIGKEWRRHESRFASAWRVSMVSKRKQILLEVEEIEQKKLREEINTIRFWERTAEQMQKGIAAMQKDIHLIEAALATHSTITALDEKVRNLFARSADSIEEISPIVWVNPIRENEQPLNWLKAGAQPEDKRRLGFRIVGECPHCAATETTLDFIDWFLCPTCRQKVAVTPEGSFQKST